jgi:inner membrane protein involved in colicin E2 resistance
MKIALSENIIQNIINKQILNQQTQTHSQELQSQKMLCPMPMWPQEQLKTPQEQQVKSNQEQIITITPEQLKTTHKQEQEIKYESIIDTLIIRPKNFMFIVVVVCFIIIILLSVEYVNYRPQKPYRP